MAKLVYDENGRLLFTKEMKQEYTILMPQMLPIHFGMFRKLLELEGYHVDQLNNEMCIRDRCIALTSQLYLSVWADGFRVSAAVILCPA